MCCFKRAGRTRVVSKKKPVFAWRNLFHNSVGIFGSGPCVPFTHRWRQCDNKGVPSFEDTGYSAHGFYAWAHSQSKSGMVRVELAGRVIPCKTRHNRRGYLAQYCRLAKGR